jgi:hypothetical protein
MRSVPLRARNRLTGPCRSISQLNIASALTLVPLLRVVVDELLDVGLDPGDLGEDLSSAVAVHAKGWASAFQVAM